MGIYYIYYLINIFLAFLGYTNISNLKGSVLITKNGMIRFSLIVLSLFLIFISGFRSLNVGTDTMTYYGIFQEINCMQFFDIHNYYVELGYSIMNWAIAKLTNNFHYVLLLNSMISIVGIVNFVTKSSCDSIFSIFIFVTMGYFASSMNVMRQFIALAFALEAIYYFAWHNRIVKSIIFIVLGSLFHSSILVFLPIGLAYYFIVNAKRISKRFVKIIYLGIAIILSVGIDAVINILSDIGLKSVESMTEDVGIKGNFLSFGLIVKICFIVLYIYLKKKNLIGERDIYSMNFMEYLLIISCFVNILSSFYPLISRFNIYFSIVLVVFIPSLIKYVPVKQKGVMTFFVYILFSLLFFFELPNKDIVPWEMFI